MKLSELVAFRNKINGMSIDTIKEPIRIKLDEIAQMIEAPFNNEDDYITNSFALDINVAKSEIAQAFNNFDSVFNQVKKRVQEQIEEQEKHWYQVSYEMFEVAKDCETTDQILYGRSSTSEKSANVVDTETILRSKLSSYADWRFPGIIIRPGIDDFVESMVGYDPLYVMDQSYELLEPCLKRFPKQYQNRLRPYVVNEWSKEPLLGQLPDDQFGMCLLCNVFNYRPVDIIRKYLEEIYIKLRPGGILLVNFNDCDRASAVKLVEQFAGSYTPGGLIQGLIKSVGFKQVSTWDDGGPSVWLELHKPGELISNRGGQSIATIHRTDDFLDDIDFLKRRAYTKKELDKLHDQARTLGIDENIISTYAPYDLQLHVHENLERLRREQELEYNKQQIAKLKALAVELGIDPEDPNVDSLIREVLDRREAERIRVFEEEKRIAQELEEKRINELHHRARSVGLDPEFYPNEAELLRHIGEAIEQQKKLELRYLRQRAMELRAGDPNLIKYGYSAEKLKILIEEKEKEQK